MTISKEVKVGLLALIAGVILYVGFNFLKGVDFFSPTNTYYVVYDNIDGLTAANPVLLNGLSVGRVHQIKILPGPKHKLLVRLEINQEIKLGDSTQAILASNGLLEGKSIVLNVKLHQRVLQHKDTLIGGKEVGITDLLSSRATPLLGQIDTAFHGINSVLAQIQAEKRIQNILANMEETTAGMKELMANNGRVYNMLGNMEKLSASLVETEKSIKPLINKMNGVADSLNRAELASTINNANQAIKEMQGILNKIQRGEGTMGKLVNDDMLYKNLNKTAEDLDKLFIDIKARPKRYVHFSVFSKKEKDK